jgi:hypothetical protein
MNLSASRSSDKIVEPRDSDVVIDFFEKNREKFFKVFRISSLESENLSRVERRITDFVASKGPLILGEFSENILACVGALSVVRDEEILSVIVSALGHLLSPMDFGSVKGTDLFAEDAIVVKYVAEKYGLKR